MNIGMQINHNSIYQKRKRAFADLINGNHIDFYKYKKAFDVGFNFNNGIYNLYKFKGKYFVVKLALFKQIVLFSSDNFYDFHSFLYDIVNADDYYTKKEEFKAGDIYGDNKEN